MQQPSNPLTVLLLLLCCSACIAPSPQRSEPAYEPVLPIPEPGRSSTLGAVFKEDQFDSLFADRRAFRVGDIVTIRLEERTSSSKSAETSVSKDQNSQALNPLVFGEDFGSPISESMNLLNHSRTFGGSADSDQSNRLDGTITAIVAEVYHNGLMRVRGEKWLRLNRGEEFLRVSGLLRSEDIGDDNSVSSARLADARFAYSGTGELADSNAPGWLSRFFLSPKFPF